MTLPAIPADYLTGDSPPADEFNNILANLRFAVTPDQPGALLRRTTYQTGIASGVATVISWQVAEDDDTVMWSAGAPTVITIKKNGLYLVGLQPLFSSNGTGTRRWGYVTKNSTSVSTGSFLFTGTSPAGQGQAGITRERLVVNDIIRGYVEHDATASLSMQSDYGGTRMFLHWVGA